MPSIEARSKLRLVLHCNECASSSQKGARWDMSARSQLERSGRFTVGSGEVAHLFRRLGARTLKMLSVKRGRAGRLDVQNGSPSPQPLIGTLSLEFCGRVEVRTCATKL